MENNEKQLKKDFFFITFTLRFMMILTLVLAGLSIAQGNWSVAFWQFMTFTWIMLASAIRHDARLWETLWLKQANLTKDIFELNFGLLETCKELKDRLKEQKAAEIRTS